MKLIKLLTCFIILSSFNSNIEGQVVTRSYNSDDFTKMMKSQLMVVLIGDNEYDEGIRKAMELYWKISSYEFITLNELKSNNKIVQDESKSFLMPFLVTVTFDFKPGTAGHKYDKVKSWLTIINGGKKKISSYTDNDAICIAPFNLYGDEADFSKCAYRIDYMVKGIHNAVETVQSKKMSGNAIKMPMSVMDEINKKTSIIKKKTLIVNKESVNTFGKKVINQKDFESHYTYKYKLVTSKEFKEILGSDNEEYVCLMPVSEVNKHVLIYEPSTKETVYYGWAMQGLDVSKKDIKKIVETAK